MNLPIFALLLFSLLALAVALQVVRDAISFAKSAGASLEACVAECNRLTLELQRLGKSDGRNTDKPKADDHQRDARDATAARMTRGDHPSLRTGDMSGLEGVVHPLTEPDSGHTEAEDHGVFAADVLQVKGRAATSGSSADHDERVIPVLDGKRSKVHAGGSCEE